MHGSLYSYPFVIMCFRDVDHRLYLSGIFLRACLPEKDMRNDLSSRE